MLLSSKSILKKESPRNIDSNKSYAILYANRFLLLIHLDFFSHLGVELIMEYSYVTQGVEIWSLGSIDIV